MENTILSVVVKKTVFNETAKDLIYSKKKKSLYANQTTIEAQTPTLLIVESRLKKKPHAKSRHSISVKPYPRFRARKENI